MSEELVAEARRLRASHGETCDHCWHMKLLADALEGERARVLGIVEAMSKDADYLGFDRAASEGEPKYSNGTRLALLELIQKIEEEA